MAVWTGNLTDVGLGHLAGLNPEIQFHLNGPQMGNGGVVYATKPAKTVPASSGAFTVDLVDTSAMYGDAWLEMHVIWNEPSSGGATGYSPVDVHIKTPLRTNGTGGPISNTIGAVSNLTLVYISLDAPAIKMPFMLWLQQNPDNINDPLNTSILYRWENL